MVLQGVPLGVHQHETRGVPQLVAEVAIAFAALQVEVDIASQRCVGGHGEAQCIGAVSGKALWVVLGGFLADAGRSEEHTSELQSLMRISYAVFCLKKKKKIQIENDIQTLEKIKRTDKSNV